MYTYGYVHQYSYSYHVLVLRSGRAPQLERTDRAHQASQACAHAAVARVQSADRTSARAQLRHAGSLHASALQAPRLLKPRPVLVERRCGRRTMSCLRGATALVVALCLALSAQGMLPRLRARCICFSRPGALTCWRCTASRSAAGWSSPGPRSGVCVFFRATGGEDWVGASSCQSAAFRVEGLGGGRRHSPLRGGRACARRHALPLWHHLLGAGGELQHQPRQRPHAPRGVHHGARLPARLQLVGALREALQGPWGRDAQLA